MNTLDNYAVFEHRGIENKQKTLVHVRGWWLKEKDIYLGSVKNEARETLKLKFNIKAR